MIRSSSSSLLALLVAETDFVATAPALSPLDPWPPLRHPVGIYVAAIAIKGLVARDNEHVETPGGGRVRAVYSIPAAAGKRARAPKTASARETTTRSSSKGSDWAMPSRNIPLSGKSNPSCWPLGREHYGLVGRNRCSEGPGCTRGGGPGWVDPVVTYSGRPIAS